MGMPADKLPENRPPSENPMPFSLFLEQDTFYILSKAVDFSRKQNAKVGTEHLLLAITDDPNSLAYKVLADNGYNSVGKIILYINLIGPGRHPTDQSRIEFTLGAEEAMKIAAEETRKQKRDRMLPEDLLIGLVKATDGVAHGVLTSLGFTEMRVRAAIKILSAEKS